LRGYGMLCCIKPFVCAISSLLYHLF
jgi:hypothetical protein